MEIWTRAKSELYRVIGLLAFFSFFVNLLLLVMPLYMLQIYDRILPSQSLETLTFLSIIAVAALVLLGFLEAVRAIIGARVGARLEVRLGEEALRHSIEQSRQSGGSVKITRDLATVRGFVSSKAIFALLDFPFSPLFVGLLYFIHPVLFWMTTAGAVVLVIIAIVNQKLIAKPSMQAAGAQQQALRTARSLAANSDSVRAMGMSQSGTAVWGQANAKALTIQEVVDRRNAILSGLSRAIRMGLQIGILGVGAYLVLQGEMSAGMIFAASIISGRGLQPIDQLVGGWRQITAANRAWTDLKQAFDAMPPRQTRTAHAPPTGAVTVENVVVSAPGSGRPPILNHVNLAFDAGDMVAVIGASGSGKSTLSRVLVGAQKPTAGTVRIDGTDLDHWQPEQLGAAIGYLEQNVELFSATVKQNIARLDRQAPDPAVLDAAAKANVHELIQSLPDGYETMLGPDGMVLSGGQAQRVALARAFYGNPPIMVLDEPNAHLDPIGDAALSKALEEAKAAGATVFLVTQRANIISSVDKIVRLKDGAVEFSGTVAEFEARLAEGKKKRQPHGDAPEPARIAPGHRQHALQAGPAGNRSLPIKRVRKPGGPGPGMPVARPPAAGKRSTAAPGAMPMPGQSGPAKPTQGQGDAVAMMRNAKSNDAAAGRDAGMTSGERPKASPEEKS